MGINNIYQKAERMVRERRIAQNEFMKCLEAGICPTCGDLLETAGLSGEKHVLCICKKGCSLISPWDVDYGSLKHDIWKDCINNIIRKAAVESQKR